MPGEGDRGKSIHVAVGLFFFINFCIGTGFLSFPYVFVYSGLLAAIPTTLFGGFATWLCNNYVLEVTARAQVSS